jgi:hypothetical protein
MAFNIYIGKKIGLLLDPVKRRRRDHRFNERGLMNTARINRGLTGCSSAEFSQAKVKGTIRLESTQIRKARDLTGRVRA